jgi:hypothetical protein
MNDNMSFGEFMDMYESCMDLGAAECILFGFGFHQIIFSLSSLAEAILPKVLAVKSPSLYYVGLCCFIKFIKVW